MFVCLWVVGKKMLPLFTVLSSVLCFEFIFSATHKCNTLCHEAITVQVTIFWVCSTFFGFQLEFHDVNLVKTSIGSSGWVGGGQETWNLCCHLWWPSFLWLVCTGLRGTMAPSAPPWIRYCKLCTGKSINIYRSFATTILNQVMSLLSVKLSWTHLVSCTVIATWHRVLH